MAQFYSMQVQPNIDSNRFNRLLNLTSEEKRKRINRFKFFIDAKRCLLGDLLSRFALCKQLQVQNNTLCFHSNRYGKPMLIEPNNYYFNISHSGDWVVCAVDDQPIGIDIEVIKEIDFDLARRFFSKLEYVDLMNQPEKNRLSYFYTLWTLKESYIKAIGKGLSIPLGSFSFQIDHNGIHLKSSLDFASYHFYNYPIDNKHQISICSAKQHDAPELKQLSIEHLLTLEN